MLDDELALWRRLRDTPELVARVEAADESEFRLQSRLRVDYPADLVRLACQLVDARRRGAAKFQRAAAMWFDRKGLEQSTAEPVAWHKASRFANVESTVWDLCCGIGGDSIALASQGLTVQAVDRSPLAGLWTQWNAQTYGVAEQVRVSVAAAQDVNVDGAWVHLDPDRRAGRDRARKLEDYEPTLETLRDLMQRSRGGALKLSPASNFGGKFPATEIELISWRGECKEATVWWGELAGAAPMRATVLPAGLTFAGDPGLHRSRVAPLQRYLYDPDPAIVRAGLVDLAAETLALSRLDDAEEYLTSDSLTVTPAAAAFEVLAETANNPRAMRDAVRAQQFGDLEIKSRHVPTDAATLRAKMPLQGSGRGTLIVARVQGKTRAVVCRRVE